MITHGSLFAGCGGLDLGIEHAFGGETIWQLDRVGHEIRSRHWPDSEQIVTDVTERFEPTGLAHVDLLSAGFSCKDVSVAGSGDLLDGRHTGPTYRAVLRCLDALLPPIVILENTPRLLTRLRATIEDDLHERGYGVTWVRCRALDAGAPHLRRRVFVFAELGGADRGVLDAPRDGAWSAEDTAERTWATPCARDYKTGGLPRVGSSSLNVQAPGGRRLNPDWVEQLQGLPVGWTHPDGPSLREAWTPNPQWPRGRYPKGWDWSVPWPQHPWEAARTLSDDLPPVRGRPARLRAAGNLAMPAQVVLAIETWDDAIFEHQE